MNLFITGSVQPRMSRALLSSTLNGTVMKVKRHTSAQVLISYLETLIYKVFVLRGNTQSLNLRGKGSRINSPRQRPLKLETPSSSSTVKTLQRNIQSSSSFALLQYKIASHLTRSRRCFRQCAGVEKHSDSPRAASRRRQCFWFTSSSSIDSICCHSARHAHLY